MPLNTANPLTGYVHAELLEEGCIELTKTVVEKEDEKRGLEVLCESELGSSSDEDEEVGVGEDNGEDHANLHLKWTWTEVKN
jgi:hypothetical protein